MININAIVATNAKRNIENRSEYNQLTGEGSLLKRFRFQISETDFLLLPEVMLRNSFIAALHKKGGHLTSAELTNVRLLRVKYDFEYWCITCVKIQDKLTKRLTPFMLRRPQLKMFNVMVSLLFENKPIRIILLKARQWGGSTLVQIFMAWIQLFHRKGWHSVVVADVEDQSRNIKSMYSKLAINHPSEVLSVTFKGFEGSSKNKVIVERDCIIYLGSMQKPDSLRSADVMMAHLSEVGLWKETEGKKPEDLVQSIAGTVPLESYSVIVMESTAKGIGNFFHREWLKAKSKQSGYIPVFVAWWEIEMYQTLFVDENEMRTFVGSLSPQECSYFKLGATLEAINWYRTKKYTESYDDWRMGCEFPTTPEEAFQSTGNRVHPPLYVTQMRKFCSTPKYVGDLFADKHSGVEALSSLHFEDCVNGIFWLWAKPDKEISMSNRYVVSMDIGGKSESADWSVISVIDRYWLSEGGVEECIGTCRFHLDQDLAIWKAVQIAKYFNNALLVVESNSLNHKGDEGDHTLTILDEMKGVYTNLYYRTDPQKIKEGLPPRYGFHTNSASKTDLINQMNKRFREIGHYERDSRALDEADNYETKSSGSFGSVDGTHDDIYMSRAIGLKASSTMDIPKLIEERRVVRKATPRIRGIANM